MIVVVVVGMVVVVSFVDFFAFMRVFGNDVLNAEFGAFFRQFFVAQRIVDHFGTGLVFVLLVESFKVDKDGAVVRAAGVVENTDDFKRLVKIAFVARVSMSESDFVADL